MSSILLLQMRRIVLDDINITIYGRVVKFFIIMESIIWSEVSFDEFKTHFRKLGKSRKCRNFLIENQENIANLRNPEILSFLCAEGYFHALIPLFECGSDEQKYLAFTQVYGKEIRAMIYLDIAFHRKVMEYASKNLKMMMFVRNNTVLLQGFDPNMAYIREDIYKNASNEVINYLFGWVIKYRIPIHKTSGEYLFAKADKKLIISYLKIIGSFIGKNSHLNFRMLNCMFKRDDLSYADKREVMFLAINSCRLADGTITKLHKTEFLA